MSDVPINQIICGDAIETLKGLPAGSVQCVITSPPYWGLRDYGIEPSQWPSVTFTPVAGLPEMTIQGCEPDCEHEWGLSKIVKQNTSHTTRSNLAAAANTCDGGRRQQANRKDTNLFPKEISQGQYCQKCGGWRGVHGLEPDPWSYVAHEVMIFREVRRVLRDDGVLWLNLGSSYAGSWGDSGHRPERTGKAGHQREKTTQWFKREGHPQDNKPVTVSPAGFNPKDLIDIPHMVVHALQADGWWLRQAMPWCKRNPMPESTTDRPTNALEFVFLLTKSARYYFDMEAVRMEGSGLSGGACFGKVRQDGPSSRRMKEGENESIRSGTRAYRNTDLWYQSVEKPFGMVGANGELVGFDVLPQGFKEAHFATFGTEFVRPLLKSGTSAKGACPKCGAPWEWVVEKTTQTKGGGRANVCGGSGFNGWEGVPRATQDSLTIGWRPTCKCYGRWYTYRYKDGKGKWHSEPYWRSGKHPKLGPCVVLDLFGGSGTVGYVAAQEKRDYVLIEVNPEYCDMGRKRLADVEEMPLVEAAKAEKGLFGQS